jgi:hypothetical protein
MNPPGKKDNLGELRQNADKKRDKSHIENLASERM